jgi:hypothetical protein
VSKQKCKCDPGIEPAVFVPGRRFVVLLHDYGPASPLDLRLLAWASCLGVCAVALCCRVPLCRVPSILSPLQSIIATLFPFPSPRCTSATQVPFVQYELHGGIASPDAGTRGNDGNTTCKDSQPRALGESQGVLHQSGVHAGYSCTTAYQQPTCPCHGPCCAWRGEDLCR